MITYITFALPFAIWMLKGFHDAIPTELEAAAVVFTVPVLIFFLVVQNRLASGLVRGAIKG